MVDAEVRLTVVVAAAGPPERHRPAAAAAPPFADRSGGTVRIRLAEGHRTSGNARTHRLRAAAGDRPAPGADPALAAAAQAVVVGHAGPAGERRRLAGACLA